MKAHGPRRTKIAAMPARAAGPTSLSSRSPTYATSPAARCSSATIRSKKAGSGFWTPQPSDEAAISSGTPMAPSTASVEVGWLPAIPSR
jgi:hypothetical protein